eukprot:GGOE01013401.1.p1 GENE.GGOE01013401.1~~GGOE01013401.1.p1  ORF type:complete len:558 (-),score=116.08 GGOE01013401.1:1110-2714(-)
MAEDLEVVGDPHRLKQILLNLLSNALKFTIHGSVVLSVQLLPASPDTVASDGIGRGCIHFTVRDTGLGIAPEVIRALFHPYSQASASTTRTHGGTGLGLVVSRMLAEAMGGRLWLESTVGEGTAFHFTVAASVRHCPVNGFPGRTALLVDDVPCRAALLEQHLQSLSVQVHHTTSAMAELPVGCDIVLVAGTPSGPLPVWPAPWALVGNATNGETSQRPGGAPPAFLLLAVVSQRHLRRQLEALWTPQPLPSTPPMRPCGQWDHARELAGLKVLVVDDVEVNRVVLLGFLKRLDCLVDVRGNGAEAVAAIAAKDYDIAILDLQMPVLDGLDAARLVKDLPRVPLLVAASSTPGELVHSQCLDAGFGAFIQKPIRFPELCHLLLEMKRGQCCSRSSSDDVPDPDSASEGGDAAPPSSNWSPGRMTRLLDKPVCTCSRHAHDADTTVLLQAGPNTPSSASPTATCRTCHGSTHLKMLSSLRNAVSLALKAPSPEVQAPSPSPAEQKSPRPPKSISCNSKRPSRRGNIFCPEPTVGL